MALVGPDSEHYDKRFTWLINGTCEKELLFDGCRWAEGPVWFRDGNMLVWSDIPNNRMLRWVLGTAASASFAPIRTIPTAIRATAKAALSPASMARAASPAPRSTAPSP